MRQIHAIKKLCSILQISDPGALSYNADKIPVLALKSGEKITGFVTILQHLMENTADQKFALKETEANQEQALQISQWLEYGTLFVHTISMSDDKSLIRNLLEELNNYLVIKSYLVGESITVADLVVYFFIQDTIKYLPYLDKEKYLNLSRWCNHIQQLSFVQKTEKQINLSTTYLVGWATGTHA